MRPVPFASLILSVSLAACGGGDPAPLSYDPPGSTVTTGREIHDQPRRTIGFSDTGVWVSNEYVGARLSDFMREDSIYRAVIRPENSPINNSAWYGFKIWADRADTVDVLLTYEDGDHRYWPKTSADGRVWTPLDGRLYLPDTALGTALLRLPVGPDTLWVSGQELRTSAWFDGWTAGLAERPGVERGGIGTSNRGRELTMLAFGQQKDPEGLVLVMGRQHPPEVTGTLALETFVESLLAEDSLAAAFRDRYRVLVVPLVNPDGVDGGHWRHNARGVDLNRDWLHFNQPEPRHVRNAFNEAATATGAPVVFGIDFHSTQEDVFYTHTRDLAANRPLLIDAWLGGIGRAVPGYEVVDEPSGLGSPVSKNWFFEAFGATSVTYEVGDEQDRDLLRNVATASARVLMQLLMEGGTEDA